MAVPQTVTHSTPSAGLADVLERVLDKGLVIAGDIKIKLLHIELLTIQIRLVIASVEKARELGLDWWATNPEFCPRALAGNAPDEVAALRQRVEQLEGRLVESLAVPAI